jgi:hypothetical protein
MLERKLARRLRRGEGGGVRLWPGRVGWKQLSLRQCGREALEVDFSKKKAKT